MSNWRDNQHRYPMAGRRQFTRSPHLLNLKQEEPAVAEKPTEAKRRLAGRRAIWQRILDEQLHLKGLKNPTLTTHPKGWRDFPAKEAVSVGQAFWIMLVRFFREHPLADLTVLTVVHLTAVIVWKAASWPLSRLGRRQPKAVPAGPTVATPAIPFTVIQTPTQLPSRVSRKTRAAQAAQARAAAQAAQTLQAARLSQARANEARAAAAEAAPMAKARPLRQWRLLPAWPYRKLAFAVAGLLLAVGLAFGPSLWSAGKTSLTQTVAAAKNGASRLLLAGEAMAAGDLNQAQGAFTEAAQEFDQAKSRLGRIGLALAKAVAVLPLDSQVTAAGPLIAFGDELSQAGMELTAALAGLQDKENPLEKATAFRQGLDRALPHLERASAEIERVQSGSLPPDYRQPVEVAQAELPRLTAEARRLSQALGLAEWALGQDSTRRFLVIFQNNAELRATGGFIGSFAIMDLDRGEIEKLEIPGGGSYDLQGSLRVRLASPQPLRLVRAGWEFQDANWFADFPTSAEKLAWFLEKSGGPSVDGVIAINVSLMERLLAVVGPIAMPEYGKTVDQENFWFETQKQVEMEYDKEENRPKQFIADMAPKLIERLLAADRPTTLKLATVLNDSLATKDALVWFRDSERQATAQGLDWTGQLKPASGDYLAIVHSNIAGQKTDMVMADKVDHSVQVLADGTATVTLTMERTHTGQKGDLFNGVRNVDFVRVYVPRGSQLLDADGFRAPDPKLFGIPEPDRTDDPLVAASEASMTVDSRSGVRTFEETGKTVFGGWLQTDPGETSVATLVYRLPPDTVRVSRSESELSDAFAQAIGAQPTGELAASYSLLLQKQPGARPAQFTSRLDLPRGFVPIWQSPTRQEDDRGRWQANLTLDRDTSLSAIATAPGQ